MALKLVYHGHSTVPVEIEGITPDTLRGLSLAEIERREIFQGNQKTALAEFFRISGSADDERMDLEGELAGVHWIGTKMTSGTIHIAGNAGRHVGSEMKGGEIHVQGNVGDWLGGEMKGGRIHVRGNAGHLVGAAYRGSRRGMTRGTILVEGDVGNETGHTMRRGLIAIGGRAGDLVGFNMLAGTILIFGECGIRVGAGMKRGTIGLFGSPVPPMLASFRKACRFQPIALSLLAGELKRLEFSQAVKLQNATIDLWNGDLIEGGRGEILIHAA